MGWIFDGMNPKELQKLAYHYHYDKRDFIKALEIYRQIIDQFPNTPEANYAEVQIRSIKERKDEDYEKIDWYMKKYGQNWKIEMENDKKRGRIKIKNHDTLRDSKREHQTFTNSKDEKEKKDNNQSFAGCLTLILILILIFGIYEIYDNYKTAKIRADIRAKIQAEEEQYGYIFKKMNELDSHISTFKNGSYDLNKIMGFGLTISDIKKELDRFFSLAKYEDTKKLIEEIKNHLSNVEEFVTEANAENVSYWKDLELKSAKKHLEEAKNNWKLAAEKLKNEGIDIHK